LAASVKQIADPALAIFDNCPSITILGISCDEKVRTAYSPSILSISPRWLQTIISTSGFNPPDKHTHLERIVFRLPEHLNRWDTKIPSMAKPLLINFFFFSKKSCSILT
jgi:hypothetical protein